jgi:cysteine synthase B
MQYPTIDQTVGNSRLVKLQRIPGKTSNTILAKARGRQPCGQCKRSSCHQYD